MPDVDSVNVDTLRNWRLVRQLRSVVYCLFAVAGALLSMPVWAAGQQCIAPNWPAWDTWASRYVQEDGRVLESSLTQNHSSSEGQAYSMMFALIGNDPLRFEHLWQWTKANMMGSDLGNRLPGWLWGKGADDKWQVQDGNSAADADLWMVYALLEAARLWKKTDYRDDALRLLATIESQLIVDLPGLGKMVLPGPEGFIQRNVLWTLNPSYLPVPLLRRLAKEAPKGPWKDIADNTVTMIQRSSTNGYAADWVGYRITAPQAGKFVVDQNKGDLGSYDAIRVYLWAGMTPAKDPAFKPLLAALGGMQQATTSAGSPPEKVRVGTGALEGTAPFGFYAALVPYFMARGETRLAVQMQRRAQEKIDAALAQNNQRPELLYYNMMLSLFGLGWAEKRYQFRNDGTLKLSWEKSCARTVLR